jgi:hypothetical protein
LNGGLVRTQLDFVNSTLDGVTASQFDYAWSSVRSTRTTNLLERAISTDDADRAAKIIQNALGIESDDVANYCFPKSWPSDREQRARIIGDWLRAEARYLA